MTPKIAAAFDAHEPPVRARLLDLRATILNVGGQIAGLDAVEESLKWGQPSYAPQPKLGTPIRLGRVGAAPALFVHCGTSLIADFGALEPEARVEGRRALIADGLSSAPLRHFIQAAFTYHRVS